MNRRGFTLVELLVSFILVMVVMVFLSKIIIVAVQKEDKLLSMQEYTAFEATFLKAVEKDLSSIKDVDILEENNTISIGDKKIEFITTGDNKGIIFDGTIYPLPSNTNFVLNDNRCYEISGISGKNKAIIRINLRQNNEDRKVNIIVNDASYIGTVTITLDSNLYDGTSNTVLVTPSTKGTTSIMSNYSFSLSPASGKINRPYTSKISATNGTIYAITYSGIKYGFEGYYTGKACTGTQRITDSGTYTNFTNRTYKENGTLYACWRAVNAGSVTNASYVKYTCTVTDKCASLLGNTVQKALDNLNEILGS